MSDLSQLLSSLQTETLALAILRMQGHPSEPDQAKIVDRAQKRIFSLFELLTKQRDAEHIPFDAERAAKGEPIQVLFGNIWYDAEYIGKGRIGHVVHCASVPDCTIDLSYWTTDKMRMTSRTKQLQMFANVRRVSSGAVFGALYDCKKTAELNAQGANTSGTPLVTAFPVTVTVSV